MDESAINGIQSLELNGSDAAISESGRFRCAYMYILGEGAEEKALKLDGTDVGGWTVVAWAFPHPKVRTDAELAAKRAKARYEATRSLIGVRGYDTSLPEDDIKSALTGHFASCGEITEVHVSKSCAVVVVMGEGAKDKALALNGSDMRGCTLGVEPAYKPNNNKRPHTYLPAPVGRFAAEHIKVRKAELARMLKKNTATTEFKPYD